MARGEVVGELVLGPGIVKSLCGVGGVDDSLQEG